VSGVELTQRENKVLRLLIESHVKTARPVSSRAIASSRGMTFSSATVRNVLRSLEEKKLILQPHTSAGRVPTDKGYRYYVDYLMQPAAPSGREREVIEERLAELRATDQEMVATELSRLVSAMARELTVSITPGPSGVLGRIDLVPFGGGRAVAVATMRSGVERTISISLEDTGDADLSEAARVLNEWLAGSPVVEARRLLERRMREVRPPVRRVLEALLRARRGLLSGDDVRSVHYEGARYMFRHPEFMSDAACLGDILDSDELLAHAVGLQSAVESVTVRIGQENRLKEMRKMSLVAGSYRIGGGLGRMAVIGPTRMKYPRLVGLVEFLSGKLETVLKGPA